MKQALLVALLLITSVAVTLYYGGAKPTSSQKHDVECAVAKWYIEAKLVHRDAVDFWREVNRPRQGF